MRKGLIIGLLMICLLINVVSATTSFTSYVLNNTGHSWSFPSNASLTSAQVYNQTWLNFDGVNDGINQTYTYVRATGGFSVWFKPNTFFQGSAKVIDLDNGFFVITSNSSNCGSKSVGDWCTYLYDGSKYSNVSINDSVILNDWNHIVVTWNGGTEWTTNFSAPVMAPIGNENNTAWGSVWKEGSNYYFYYSYYYNNKLSIGLATSTNGINWTRDTINNPLIDGGFNTYANGGVWDPMVWKEGSNWYMIYTGRNNSAMNNNSIHIASSSNGINWKYLREVYRGTLGQWDENDAENFGIIKVNSTYYLWYNTLGNPTGRTPYRRIGLLTSSDLITWTNYTLTTTYTFGNYNNTFQAFPFKNGDKYYLMFMRYQMWGTLILLI